MYPQESDGSVSAFMTKGRPVIYAGNQIPPGTKVYASLWRIDVKKTIGFAILLGLLGLPLSLAERPEPQVVATIGGDEVYQVLPVGAIPAIDEPEFVSGVEADRQMRPKEPVLGVVVDGEARAYSLWQLDAHEIVNDEIAGTAIAATW
jgi:hypothetical protein